MCVCACAPVSHLPQVRRASTGNSNRDGQDGRGNEWIRKAGDIDDDHHPLQRSPSSTNTTVVSRDDGDLFQKGIGYLGDGRIDYSEIVLNPTGGPDGPNADGNGGTNKPPRKLSTTAEGWLEIRSNEICRSSNDG